VEAVFPESYLRSFIPTDHIYYETRNFLHTALPFSFHKDRITKADQHYVHKHREIEILIPREGKGLAISDLTCHKMTVGDILVINSNRVHYTVSDSSVSYDCIIVDNEFLSSNGVDISSVIFDERFCDDDVMLLVDRMNQEWSRYDPYRNPSLRAILLEIMVILCRRHTVTVDAARKEQRSLQKIKQSIGYIRNNFRRELTLEDISEQAGLSKYYFCREFKKATDLTPIEYINRTRCEFAKTLLESRRYSVAEVGEMCGYTTTAHFSRTFSNFFGMNPSDYQKQIRIRGDGEGAPE